MKKFSDINITNNTYPSYKVMVTAMYTISIFYYIYPFSFDFHLDMKCLLKSNKAPPLNVNQFWSHQTFPQMFLHKSRELINVKISNKINDEKKIHIQCMWCIKYLFLLFTMNELVMVEKKVFSRQNRRFLYVITWFMWTVALTDLQVG